MGGRKKRSTRCKTSKREHKHKKGDKQPHHKATRSSFRSPFPSKSRPAIRISPSPLMSSRMSSLLQRSNRKRRASLTAKQVPASPALKCKIDRFLFGGTGEDEKKGDAEAAESAKYDVLKISNLDKRVFNEKLIAKIIHRQMRKMQSSSAAQVSLKSIAILTVRDIKIAKITLKTGEAQSGLAEDIVRMLNGKKLFGKVLQCELVQRKA